MITQAANVAAVSRLTSNADARRTVIAVSGRATAVTASPVMLTVEAVQKIQNGRAEETARGRSTVVSSEAIATGQFPLGTYQPRQCAARKPARARQPAVRWRRRA